jgi:hypothetical protein
MQSSHICANVPAKSSDVSAADRSTGRCSALFAGFVATMARSEKPVVLPPGRAKLSTKPLPTGSSASANTIGTLPLDCGLIPRRASTSRPSGVLAGRRLRRVRWREQRGSHLPASQRPMVLGRELRPDRAPLLNDTAESPRLMLSLLRKFDVRHRLQLVKSIACRPQGPIAFAGALFQSATIDNSNGCALVLDHALSLQGAEYQ